MEPSSLLGLLRGCCKFGDCGPEVRHILCPKRREERLRTRMKELNDYKDGTLKAVSEKITEQPWLSMHPNVEVWTQSVDALSELVDGKIPQDKIEQYLEDIERLEKRRDAIKDDLVIDVIPIDYLKMKLVTDMEKLRATKRDLEHKLSELETAVVFPRRVMSESVKLWIGEFHSLETEVSKCVDSIESTVVALTSATDPNEVTVATDPNEVIVAIDPNEVTVATDPNEVTVATDPNEGTVAPTPNEATTTLTSVTDSNGVAAPASNEVAATTTTIPNEAARTTSGKESKLKRDIRTMTGRIAEHSDQLKKLKEEDGLVVEALPGIEALLDGLQDLRVKKEDLESLVSGLERAAVNPRKVRSESIKRWFGKFDSLEANISELMDSIKSQSATALANTPNAAADAAANTSSTTSNSAAHVIANTSATTSNAAEVAATHAQQKRDIWAMSGRVTELSEQLKKLKEEDELVVEAYPEVKTLLSEMVKLKAEKIDLESIVSGLERALVNPPKVRSERVKLYLGKFDSLEAEVSKLEVSIQSVVPAEISSNGVAASMAAATHIQQLLLWVAELSEQLKRLKQEDGLVVEAPPQHIHELPGQSADFVVGIEEKLEEVGKMLNDEETKVILIHGMGGSGKTTLVRELTQKLKLRSTGGDGFDFIFSIVVSQNLNFRKIQEDVFVQLGYKRNDPSLPQNIDDRANFIKEKLNNRSFLLVLDDLWEPLHDLSKLGFQYSSSKMCKVIVTSRNRDVCEERESLPIFEIGLLEKKHAWQLFCRFCKKGLVEFDEQIKSLAWKIVDKCGGLPLILKTVASTMTKNRNYEDWLNAQHQLHNYYDAIESMKQVYEVLKFSFDKLENDGLRQCLLYCALFPEDFNIPLDELIPYLIAEGFVEGIYDFDTLNHKAYFDIIIKLEEASLLERGQSYYVEEDYEYVKLHDAVRDMVLWLDKDWKVLTRLGKGIGGCISVDDSWVGVRMASIMHNRGIEEIAGGEVILSSLRALLMRNVGVARYHSPESLFPQFSSLCTLDLSHNWKLTEIPKSIGSLKSLRYLSMSHTCVRTLPVEMGNLTNLHTLDLSETGRLTYIPQVAIAPLRMLQSLNLWQRNCFKDEEVEGKLQPVHVSRRLLPKLKDVGLTLFRTTDVDAAQSLFPLTSSLNLENIRDVTSSTFLRFQRLKSFDIHDCKFPSGEVEFRHENFSRLKILRLVYGNELRNIILRSSLWCLQQLIVDNCHNFENLGWIQQLPNLIYLRVDRCKNLRELLPKHKSENSNSESSCRYDELTPLSKLKTMQMEYQEQLESISSSNLLFPCLIDLYVMGYPKLTKLSIKSCNSIRTKVICEMEWWEGLKWEDDECNSSRFILPEN